MLAALAFLNAGSSGHALHTIALSPEIAASTVEPRLRRLSFKLPLRQPTFHWTFMSKEDLLAGKLTLRIKRAGETVEIVVFEDGAMSDGWEAIALPPNEKAGECYFGFQTEERRLTSSADTLELELVVKKDLPGIGALQSGILPAGTYVSEGAYSMLNDEYKAPAHFKDVPQATRDAFKKQVEHKAFMENWKRQWSLKITSEEGWLPAGQREMMLRLMEKMKAEAATP